MKRPSVAPTPPVASPLRGRCAARLARLLGPLLAAALATVATASTVRAQGAIVRELDSAHSTAAFSVTHLYLQRVTGTVPILAGSLAFESESIVPSSVEATLDPRHVDTRDGDRDDDLQGPDWFDTKRFPTWQFRSTKVAPSGDGRFAVDGTLTVHGTAHAVTLLVTPTRGLPHPAYHAVARVDRHAFGMKVTPMDGLLGSDVELSLDVELK